ncbi:MAG: hypothetical protein COB46_13440 [Rhodospirillaceae bacterium]|nr:MAG: hypothetical protein COB46_13440 [Rhodospirillaceae bacterium]
MKLSVGRIFLIVGVLSFSVMIMAGYVYFDQRTNNQPPQLSKAETSNIIRENEEDIFKRSDDPVLGNPNGDVTLVEFFDYRCTYCKLVHPVVMTLLKEDGNIRYVAKEYPILGPVSTLASQAALASQIQGKYAAYSNALMAAKSLGDDQIFAIAKDVGLDPIRLLDDIDAHEEDINAKISGTIALAKTLALKGTPAFIIGDQLIPGAVSKANLELLIAKARSNNRKD